MADIANGSELRNRKPNRDKQAVRERLEAKRLVESEIREKKCFGDEESLYEEFKKNLGDLQPKKTSYHLTRIVLVRYIGFIYLVAFLVAFNQNEHLLGRNGLEPANKLMQRVRANLIDRNRKFSSDLEKNLYLFKNFPTIFWFFDWPHQIDSLLYFTSLTGLCISMLITVLGASNSILMFVLWLLYHSIVNVGGTWYSFGWESQLLESGFIAIFLVPFLSLKKINFKSPPSFITILLYRWLIFRIMIGAGLIKIRGDKCWKDLTCMNYHYETQPVPNPVSFYMHKEPESMHKFEVLSNHFIELIAPFLIIMPFRFARLSGGLIQIIFQVVLIISGNLSFLNWLTILPCLACFDDSFYKFLFKSKRVNSTLWKILKNDYLLAKQDSKMSKELSTTKSKINRRVRTTVDLFLLALVSYLSMPVVMNLISSKQAMNTSFEPFRLVNTYGAFGSVTKERYEVIFKGTQTKDFEETDPKQVLWLEYQFKCKPGNVKRRPCIISPYHYRLDWLMWFAAFQNYQQNPWLLSLSAKFLYNDKKFTKDIIAVNPFEDYDPPFHVKADLYHYKYSSMNETTWWTRKFVRNYMPPVNLKSLKQYIKSLDWQL